MSLHLCVGFDNFRIECLNNVDMIGMKNRMDKTYRRAGYIQLYTITDYAIFYNAYTKYLHNSLFIFMLRFMKIAINRKNAGNNMSVLFVLNGNLAELCICSYSSVFLSDIQFGCILLYCDVSGTSIKQPDNNKLILLMV